MKALLLLALITPPAHGAAALASGVSCGNKSITWDGTQYTCTDFQVADFGASTGTLAVSKAASGANADITSMAAIKTISSAVTHTLSSTTLRGWVALPGTYIVVVSSADNTTIWGVKLNGLTTLGSRTKAQLRLDVPALGDTAYCSDCSPKKIVVGTGTNAGNFADSVGAAFK